MSDKTVSVIVSSPMCEGGADVGFTAVLAVDERYCLTELARVVRLGLLSRGVLVTVTPEMPDEMYGGCEFSWEYRVEDPSIGV